MLLKRKRSTDRNPEVFVQPASNCVLGYAKRSSHFCVLLRESSAAIPLNP